ncbi:MAG: four helix bundle protein [Candidatus Levybacteria bacterium]|nr:four helix bundle protein [Candidatus Levybacteria bacterium]
MINDFYDLDAWKESHKLVLMIYKLFSSFPREEKYGIVDQLRRAVTSISANIAEGFGRYSYKDRNHFNYQARGSAKEVQDFLLISRDLGIIDKTMFKDVWQQVKKTEMIINGLIRSTDKLK